MQSIINSKCFHPDTQILLFFGGMKAAKTLSKGDILIGDDNHPRIVMGVKVSAEQLYKIVPSNNDTFIISETQMIALYNEFTDDSIDIPLNEYLIKSDTWKTKHALYSIPVEYTRQDIKNDPYLIGILLLSKSLNIDDIMRDYLNRKLDGLSKVISNAFNKKSISIDAIDRDEIAYILNHRYIPDSYLYNTKETRYKLFKGILESHAQAERLSTPKRSLSLGSNNGSRVTTPISGKSKSPCSTKPRSSTPQTRPISRPSNTRGLTEFIAKITPDNGKMDKSATLKLISSPSSKAPNVRSSSAKTGLNNSKHYTKGKSRTTTPKSRPNMPSKSPTVRSSSATKVASKSPSITTVKSVTNAALKGSIAKPETPKTRGRSTTPKTISISKKNPLPKSPTSPPKILNRTASKSPSQSRASSRNSSRSTSPAANVKLTLPDKSRSSRLNKFKSSLSMQSISTSNIRLLVPDKILGEQIKFLSRSLGFICYYIADEVHIIGDTTSMPSKTKITAKFDVIPYERSDCIALTLDSNGHFMLASCMIVKS